MKQDKVYILYKYDNFKNDYIFIKEYLTKKDLKSENNKLFKLKDINNIKLYIYKHLTNKMHLLNDKYIIIEDIL